ncbi:MAG TPA: type II secretion system F family protein [Candidatus Wallbacteria bacterium]|nr:type II secretion system F family protein [Candidatus Wallbacteria bacterium]
MPNYEYKTIDHDGKTATGRGEAATEEAMIDSLTADGFFVVEISETRKAKKSLGESVSAMLGGLSFSRRVSQKEITFFYMQISALVGAGVTLVESLDSLAEQSENPYFKSVIQDIKTQISTGKTFYESLVKYPDIFDKLSVSMIRAGETGAGLDTVLVEIAKFSERDAKLRAKVKSAMLYPGVLSIVSAGVVCFLIIYVFPKFTKIFAKAKGGLPAPTVLLMSISKFMQAYYIHVLIAIVLIIIGFKWLLETNENFRRVFHRYILRVPIFGGLILKSSVARFSRTLGTLLQGGVPILKGLEVSEDIIGNVTLKKVISELSGGVAQGKTMYDILRQYKIFPFMVTKMVQTGEKTGTLAKLLLRAADFLEYEVEVLIEGLTSIIEPILIVGMGVVIGFIAMAMFLPMFDLTSTIK